MSVQILANEQNDAAALFCNTSDWAFGPVFASKEQAQSFLNWLQEVNINTLSAKGLLPLDALRGGFDRYKDPRVYDDLTLERVYNLFLTEQEEVTA